jgi:anti-sigma B factor antagonist
MGETSSGYRNRANTKEERWMDFITETVQGVTVVTLQGETLDASNAKALKTDLVPVLAPGAKLVFDMKGVRFVDSSGLGALLSCLRQVHSSGGDLKLCEMGKAVRALFELVRMHRIFEIYNSRDEALRSYSAGA